MFYITISNGLLKDGHHQRMGNAVWLFMWCIDKVTRIDEFGWGYVLGGKPIRLEEIQDIPRRSAQRYLSILKKEGYVETKRTPYGIIIKVKKAKKRFQGDAPKSAKLAKRCDKSGASQTKSGASNKTVQLDNINIPHASRSALLKKKKKPMKPNKMGSYSEIQNSDAFEEVVDIDTNETRTTIKKTKETEKFWELIHWAEERRGSKFFRQFIKKQFKALGLAKQNNISPSKLKDRWCEMEKDKFWIGNGFDWMDVVMSFNRRK